MYIEIAEDIISIIHNPHHDDYNRVMWVLQEIALCMKRRKHYVSIPALRKDARLKKELQDANPHIYGLIAQADDSDSQALKRSVNWYMVVTKNIPNTKEDNVLYFNPIYNHTLEIFEETHLICENLYDCEFYGLILNAYKNLKKRHGIQHNYISRNGGGATTATVVNKEIMNKNHLCLIITDSDRKYRLTPSPDPKKNPEKFGETFRKIESTITSSPYEFMHLHVLTNSREVENLIPHSILLQHLPKSSKSTEKLIKQCDTSFFDFKEGLRYSDLNAEVEYLYWKPMMEAIKVDHSKRKKYKEQAKKRKKKYSEQVEGEPPLIPGFGKSILSIVLENHKKELASQDFNKLTDDQKHDWIEVGRLIYSWTLSKKYI